MIYLKYESKDKTISMSNTHDDMFIIDYSSGGFTVIRTDVRTMLSMNPPIRQHNEKVNRWLVQNHRKAYTVTEA